MNNVKLWSKNIIIKLVLGVIICSLIFSSARNYIPYDNKKYIATVNGEKISLHMLQNMYLLENERQKKILGKNFFNVSHSAQFIQTTYNYALSQLIDNILLEQYSKKLKLTTDDEEVKNIILNASIFQENKTFNKKKYFDYLFSINLTNSEYINIIKQRLITKKLMHYISSKNFLLKTEIKRIVELLSQKRIIQKYTIKIKDILKNQKIQNKEAKMYFAKHQNNFYTKEKVIINYVKINLKNIGQKNNTTTIQQLNNNNIINNLNEEKKQYSIIQVKTKKEASLILNQLKKFNNFETIAKQKSTDFISSIHGGNIGWISKNFIPKEIKIADLNKKNTISKIIPFQKEFLIIKLNDIKIKNQTKDIKYFNNIQKKIERKNFLKLYKIIKQEISYILHNNPDNFNFLIQQINIKPITINWFTQDNLPKPFNSIYFKKNFFNNSILKKINLSKTYFKLICFKNNKLFLINIKKYKKEKIKNFKNAKKDIVNLLMYQKSIKIAQKKAKKIIFEINTNKKNILKKYKKFLHSPEIFSRYNKSNITPIIFSLPYPRKNKKIYTTLQDKNGNIIIIILSKVYNSHFSEEEKKIIEKYLEKNNTEIIFNSILKNLHEKANIIYTEK